MAVSRRNSLRRVLSTRSYRDHKPSPPLSGHGLLIQPVRVYSAVLIISLLLAACSSGKQQDNAAQGGPPSSSTSGTSSLPTKPQQTQTQHLATTTSNPVSSIRRQGPTTTMRRSTYKREPHSVILSMLPDSEGELGFNFGPFTIGEETYPIGFVISSSDGKPIDTTVRIVGDTPSDFPLRKGQCESPACVVSEVSCKSPTCIFSVSFKPTALGSRSARIAIGDQPIDEQFNLDGIGKSSKNAAGKRNSSPSSTTKVSSRESTTETSDPTSTVP